MCRHCERRRGSERSFGIVLEVLEVVCERIVGMLVRERQRV